MPLEPGPYAVTAKIGEGGMGEVYRARVTKLDRDVALKVLPEAFTSDPERLARGIYIREFVVAQAFGGGGSLPPQRFAVLNSSRPQALR